LPLIKQKILKPIKNQFINKQNLFIMKKKLLLLTTITLLSVASGEGNLSFDDYRNQFENCPIQTFNWDRKLTQATSDYNTPYSPLSGKTTLTTVNIGSKVNTIYRNFFRDCTELHSIIIPNTVTTIEQFAFHNSGLQSINFPSSITTINQYTFAQCSELTSVNIPNTITKICRSAFADCVNLLTLTLETRDINKAVTNNPNKFPEGYIFSSQNTEKQYVVETFHHLEKIKFSTGLPKAFTEKGLYMLATILKSKKAVETTIAIVETFARIRELSRIVNQITQESDKLKQKPLLKRSGELINDLLDNDLELTDSETSIELNLAMLKIKHTTKRSKK
jgi:hypothetical protein